MDITISCLTHLISTLSLNQLTWVAFGFGYAMALHFSLASSPTGTLSSGLSSVSAVTSGWSESVITEHNIMRSESCGAKGLMM